MKEQLLITVLLLFVLMGCTEFEEPTPIQESKTEPAAVAKTRAGVETFETLPDPYSLENVQAVYDEYDGYTELAATHLYVRFMPRDTVQLELLEDVYDLPLFDFPLDIDIENGEDAWQYFES